MDYTRDTFIGGLVVLISFFRIYHTYWYLSNYWSYAPHRSKTSFLSRDVTVVVATVDPEPIFRDALQSWLENSPNKIIIVTNEASYEKVLALTEGLGAEKIVVERIKRANKRHQLMNGVQKTVTPLLVLADDDSQWSAQFLEEMLPLFERSDVGAVCPPIYIRPAEGKRRAIIEEWAQFRFENIAYEQAAFSRAYGSSPIVSGATSCYRTSALNQPVFWHAFMSESFLGHPIHSGDDCFIARWLQNQGLTILYQHSPAATVWTTIKPKWGYAGQLTRWARNDGRRDLRRIFLDGDWRFMIRFSVSLKPMLLMVDPIANLYMTERTLRGRNRYLALAFWSMCFLRSVAQNLPYLLVDLRRRIYMLPLFIALQYLVDVARIYCLCTLHQTKWYTRPDSVSQS